LADVTKRRSMVDKRRVEEREAKMFASEFIRMVHSFVTSFTKRRLIRRAKHRRLLLLTHITLYLHLSLSLSLSLSMKMNMMISDKNPRRRRRWSKFIKESIQ